MVYSNTKYGKLQILERVKIENDNHITYKAICECGNIIYIRASNIRNNERQHCIHCSSKFNTHHKTNTKLFNVWQTMKQRCYYYKNKDFNNYGGRVLLFVMNGKIILNLSIIGLLKTITKKIYK